jgi:hypothetical protein
MTARRRRAFVKAVQESLRPQSAGERALASQIGELAWSLQRVGRYEAALVRACRQRGKRE